MLYLRKYKFWKQFTTWYQKPIYLNRLCCIYENTNFESNSQLIWHNLVIYGGCVVSTKIQILKAIHNSLKSREAKPIVVLYLRKYKFWKQFTTKFFGYIWHFTLCCIYENTNFESNSQLLTISKPSFCCCVVSTKIQILKAIHNSEAQKKYGIQVVLYLRKYKFWKQFTTKYYSLLKTN